ncbi:MAG: L,D-transpeptidase family protein [Acidimicrobiales bacterium]
MSRSPTTAPTTTNLPTTTTAPTTTTVPTGAAILGPGDSGPAVLTLQQRLTSLGYWLGTPDGSFGDSTEQAVYAIQKAAGISRDGIVGPVTEGALAQGVRPHPRSTSADVIEVDLEDDLLMFVTDGNLDWVLNTSTGGGYTYTDDGVTAVAVTPVGHFEIYRQVDGMVIDSLGHLWRPKFFDSGFAIHGDSYVPPNPVSHGCVRVSDEAIDWIWSDNLAPIGTSVWVY